MIDKIKIKVSSFVANVLENDALRFNFMKNGKSNKNALLNKLIPTLVSIRKEKRNEIEYILKNEYNREDGENIYNAVNTIIDRVYFNGEELEILDEYIWIRPSKDKAAVYDEIETSETLITAQETSVYLRGLLNEYSRLPQYKREELTFREELDVFFEACEENRILYFHDRELGERRKVFAFGYYCGYLYEQTNYCIIYDINRAIIKAVSLSEIQDVYFIKQKYKPTSALLETLQAYVEDFNFNKEIKVEEE